MPYYRIQFLPVTTFWSVCAMLTILKIHLFDYASIIVCMNYACIIEHCASGKCSSNVRNSRYGKDLFLGDTERDMYHTELTQ